MTTQPANDIEAAVGRIMSAADRYERSSALGPVQRWNELAAIIRAELSRVPVPATTTAQSAKPSTEDWGNLGRKMAIKAAEWDNEQQVEVPAGEPVTDDELAEAVVVFGRYPGSVTQSMRKAIDYVLASRAKGVKP